jgi:hypothetical protein
MRTQKLFDPCAKVSARQKQDYRRGITTREAAKDFIRRTCPCDVCKKWRTSGLKANNVEEEVRFG